MDMYLTYHGVVIGGKTYLQTDKMSVFRLSMYVVRPSRDPATCPYRVKAIYSESRARRSI